VTEASEGQSRKLTASADIEVARRVLRAEIAGLEALIDELGASFSAAIRLLADVEDRVIVSGMGKSGHIARKIAATFASTGTAAFFVHPAEASHGDLGMIGARDVVLALSNSGDTEELADILAHSRRFRIPLVAMTSGNASSLAGAADVTLLLPAVPEACPMGLSPTSSTTMMLALGDALAVALLERKGFSHNDYHALHPGGRLGRKLLEVADLMHRNDNVPLVRAGTAMAEAIIVMTQKSFGCVGVVDSRGRLIGIVTDGDLRRHMEHDLLRQPVETVMSAHPRTIRPHALAFEALGLMNAVSITSLFAVDEERQPLGILHIHDCLRAGIA
jgi:arabinose-5-phosphate isomerase